MSYKSLISKICIFNDNYLIELYLGKKGSMNADLTA